MDNNQKDKVVTISDLGNSDNNNGYEDENREYAGADVKVYIIY